MSKIIFLSRLFWPHVGGVETHVMGLSKKLIEKGHSVVVITEQYDDQLPLSENVDSVQIHRIPYSILQSKLSLWRWMWARRRLFKRSSVTHVHDVYWWFLPLRLRFFRNHRSYITFHGYEGREPSQKIIIQRKFFERLAIKNLCVGEFLNKWYGTDADMVSYGASEMKGKSKIKLAENIHRAVFIGRLDADTNILAYVKAIKLMKTPLMLDVFGEGDQLSDVKNFSDANTLPVAYHGWTKDILKALSGVDIAFCGGYLSILEAMLAGVLVASVYSTSIKKDYLLMHPMASQMIIAPNFVELAEAIDTLSLTQRLEMVNNAKKWASEQTFDKLCDQYLEMWAA